MFDVPVLLIVYKRKDTLLQILDRIQQIHPVRLYIASDAPNKENTDDLVKNNIVKKLIKEYPFNASQVFTHYQPENLGCGRGPKKAIDWFFEQEQKGIIIEDDCLPDLSFFTFCKEMLDKYETNENILAISGNNYLLGKVDVPDSYYFTKYPNIWGWATWKRAWEKMDWEMLDYVDFLKDGILRNYTNSETEYTYWKKQFDFVYNAKNEYWDYQWLYSIWKNKGMGIAPAVNLVKNIGFDEHATHTLKKPDWYGSVRHGSLSAVTHPAITEINQDADNFQFNNIIHFIPPDTIWLKIRRRLSALKNKVMTTETKELIWQDNEYFDPIWKERIKKMASYLKPTDTVVDLGCGMMWLKEFLSAENTYIPVDYKSRDKQTIVCDFNKKQFPDKDADVYFVSGCLEYVENPDWFINKVADFSERCVISYCTINKFSDLIVRKNLMWKNHLSEEEIINLFSKYGFSLKDIYMTDLNNQIFYFSK